MWFPEGGQRKARSDRFHVLMCHSLQSILVQERCLFKSPGGGQVEPEPDLETSAMSLALI